MRTLRCSGTVANRPGWLVVLALVAASLTFTPGGAGADSDPDDPQDPSTPPTVTADALPTAQIDGVVWSQAIAENRVYAGGSFTSARPPGASAGTSQVPRHNLLAYDVDSGELVESFAPVLNAQVTAVAVSPDQSRVYVGGDFTTVDGQARRRIAAFDTGTGALVSEFAPPLNGSVDAIVATNSTVYVGGSFQGVGNQTRSNLAAFNAADGSLLDWAPVAEDGDVRALAIDPGQDKVAIGGSFTSLNGSSKPGYGLAMVDAHTGTSLPFAANNVVRNGTVNSAITSLSSDGEYVYGGGYHFGQGGTLEGVFAADWDGGDVHWINDCHGDTYSVHPQGGVVYQAGHAHYCENIGGFRQTDGGGGSWSYYRGTAMSKAATGTVTWDPTGKYHNYEGQPAPSPQTWYPSLNVGTATGQFQGPWDVTGNDDYIVMGGEFTQVNGTGQQGLVRFATKDDAPNERGPQLFADTYPIKVSSSEPGRVRISWAANYDQDNRNLTYRVYRDSQDGAGLVHTRQSQADFWSLPGMGFQDSGLAAGSSHRYRVSATDSSGNIANSPWVDVTVATSGTESAYEQAVRDSEPTHYWRLGEPSGSTVGDTVGWEPATARAGVSRGVPGAIAGDPDLATRFKGTETGYAATHTIGNPPDTLSLEAWFKTSTPGGKIVGWGNRFDRASAKADRHVYLDGAGRIHFGVKPDATRKVVSSSRAYDDGRWHLATATLSPSGMKLYVDGSRVAARSDVTVGQHLSRGYWRIGGDTLKGWPSAPSNAYFKGAIDEVAVYLSDLRPSEIAAHYAARTGPPQPNVSPTAAFTTAAQSLSLSLNAAGSSDPDGDITAYAWNFGDGVTASGQQATHTFTAAGTYDVQLTVTDDDGATDTVTRQVTVSEGPAPNVWAADAFERSVTGGLGVSDIGGAWSRTGSAASYSVANGVGHIVTGAAGRGKAAYLGSVSSTDTDLRVDLALNKVPAGGPELLSVAARRIHDTSEYNATLRYGTGGKVTLSIHRVVNGNDSRLASETVPGLTVGDRIRLRTEVTGTSPTRLRAKAWNVTTQEPAAWQLSESDSEPALQKPGAVGVGMFLGPKLTNTPILAALDNLEATPSESVR